MNFLKGTLIILVSAFLPSIIGGLVSAFLGETSFRLGVIHLWSIADSFLAIILTVAAIVVAACGVSSLPENL